MPLYINLVRSVYSMDFFPSRCPSFTMLTQPAALLSSLLLLTSVEAIPNSRRTIKRQAPILPSDQTYINATRNDTTPVTLTIDTANVAGRNETAKDLYGLMHEVRRGRLSVISAY